MKQYKILLFQLGHAFITADSEDDALSQINNLPVENIAWIPNTGDGTEQNNIYFIASIKCIDY